MVHGFEKKIEFQNDFRSIQLQKIASYSEDKIQALLDVGIIRNQLKIRETVANAIAYIEVQKEFGSFSNYIRKFIDGKPIENNRKSLSEVPFTTPLSDTISKNLKKRGFKFVGLTVVYAHIQATGRVNDHVLDCWPQVSVSVFS